MKIECTTLRKGGSRVLMKDKTEYHFAPQADGRHIAEVPDDDHISALLAVGPSYRLPREERARLAELAAAEAAGLEDTNKLLTDEEFEAAVAALQARRLTPENSTSVRANPSKAEPVPPKAEVVPEIVPDETAPTVPAATVPAATTLDRKSVV